MSRYSGPIIDAHHHLWAYGMGRHGWLGSDGGDGDGLPMGSLAPLRRDYLVAGYLAETAGQGVVATVHVEAGWDGPPGSETAWLDTLDRSAVARRHVFRVDLGLPEAAELVRAEAAHPRAAGLRDIVAWHPDPARSFAAAAGRMSDPAWRRGLAALAETGLVFELMLYPPQMAEAEALARDFPDLTFVLNHCGSPADRSAAGMADWAAGLARLGACPNVCLKISNPVAYDHDWTGESLGAVIGTCLDAFGPQRSLFGSDLPVSGLQAEFGALLDVYRSRLSVLPEADQRAFFHDTAVRIYRIAPEAQEA
ncbi:amidohydrolase [Mangrovicoccus sp. HB161399]|uniref:amidohydrolase family protein n=1 Tax=Mangrovicoccus sp. HB161399 TaxID=2720392 RepID=UPI0015540615|nr:amidohydrolase family protein [Mangrovicoccus sp. HB161399]